MVHYGDTTLTFLANMAKADAAGKGLTYVSAVTVEEKSVLDYNQGNPTGDPAKAGTGAAAADPAGRDLSQGRHADIGQPLHRARCAVGG